MKAFIRFIAVGVALALGIGGLLLSTCGGPILEVDRGIRHINWGGVAFTAAGLGLAIAGLAIIRLLAEKSDGDR